MFDVVIIDMKDGGSVYSVMLDIFFKLFFWLGFDYNVGGVIVVVFYGFVGSFAF